MNTVAAAVLLLSIAFILATLPFVTRKVLFAYKPNSKNRVVVFSGTAGVLWCVYSGGVWA